MARAPLVGRADGVLVLPCRYAAADDFLALSPVPAAHHKGFGEGMSHRAARVRTAAAPARSAPAAQALRSQLLVDLPAGVEQVRGYQTAVADSKEALEFTRTNFQASELEARKVQAAAAYLCNERFSHVPTAGLGVRALAHARVRHPARFPCVSSPPLPCKLRPWRTPDVPVMTACRAPADCPPIWRAAFFRRVSALRQQSERSRGSTAPATRPLTLPRTGNHGKLDTGGAGVRVWIQEVTPSFGHPSLTLCAGHLARFLPAHPACVPARVSRPSLPAVHRQGEVVLRRCRVPAVDGGKDRLPARGRRNAVRPALRCVALVNV
jgi:hypothetical protein